MNHSDVVRLATWASIECEKQRSGERSVGRMIEAWHYAMSLTQFDYNQNRVYPGPPTHENIIRLGRLVDPDHNLAHQYRQVNVQVGMSKKAPWERVGDLMEQLLMAWNRLSSDEWYREFEEIHPFRDGNGRTGNILWNLHRGTLWRIQPDPLGNTDHSLDFPPDFWGDRRLSM